jgi:hypothetical protein
MVRIVYGRARQGMIGRKDNAVGEFGMMKDRSAASDTAYDAYSPVFAGLGIHFFLKPLEVPNRNCLRFPQP